jgi:uncharacterized linocin/CFP29 family protein
MTDHLMRKKAPITAEGWEALETDAKSRLTTYLGARKLIDFEGPHGWKHSVTTLGRATPISSVTDGLTTKQRNVLPLVEVRAPFAVSRAELDDAERGAQDLDFGSLDAAARQIAIGENTSVFHGYPAAGIKGIAEASSHDAVKLGADAEAYPTAVAGAVDVLKQSGIGGPYGLVIATSIYTVISETTEHGGYPLFEHLREILGGPVVGALGVEGGVVLSLRGEDFVFDCGQDISVGYSDHDAENVNLYLEESFSFRVVEPDAAVALK